MKLKSRLLENLLIAILAITVSWFLPFCKNRFLSDSLFCKPASARDNQISTKTVSIEYFETIMNKYFRTDLMAELESSINSRVDEYNEWVADNQKSFIIIDEKLDAQRNTIREMEKTINQTLGNLNKRKPLLKTKKEVADYNQMVKQNNALIEERNSLIKEYEKQETEYNQAVSHYNKNAKRNKAAIDQAETDAKKKIEEYNDWLDSDGDMIFFNELNAYYAELCRDEQRNPENFNRSSEMRIILKIRKELADYTKRKYEKENNGLIVVEALLCDKVKGTCSGGEKMPLLKPA